MAERLECSVCNTGGGGWGLRVLGGPEGHRAHFNQARGTVTLVLDGMEVKVNIAKQSFWSETSGELMKRELSAYLPKQKGRLTSCGGKPA